MKIRILTLIVLILLVPISHTSADTSTGLTESDWFLTTDFNNITFGGVYDYQLNDVSRSFIFDEYGNKDNIYNGWIMNEVRNRLYDQEYGFVSGDNKTLLHQGMDDGFALEEDYFEGILEIGDVFSVDSTILSGFNPDLKTSQTATVNRIFEESWPFLQTPVDNGTHMVVTSWGWNNNSYNTNYRYHAMYNGSSVLDVNGHYLEVYTYTVYQEMHPFSGVGYSEGYCYESSDCISYVDTEINETGYFDFVEKYEGGELIETTSVFLNSTHSTMIVDEYLRGEIIGTTTTVSKLYTGIYKTILRYSPELNFVVQVIDTPSSIFYPNKYDVRDFEVKNYIPKSTDIPQNTTITEATVVTTTVSDEDSDEPIEEITDSNPLPYYSIALIPSLLLPVIINRKKNDK